MTKRQCILISDNISFFKTHSQNVKPSHFHLVIQHFFTIVAPETTRQVWGMSEVKVRQRINEVSYSFLQPKYQDTFDLLLLYLSWFARQGLHLSIYDDDKGKYILYLARKCKTTRAAESCPVHFLVAPTFLISKFSPLD